MAKILVLILAGYLLYQMFKAKSAVRDASTSGQADEETFKDPVCGMYVARGDAVIGTLEGKKLYFCSLSCLNKFRDQLENAEHK